MERQKSNTLLQIDDRFRSLLLDWQKKQDSVVMAAKFNSLLEEAAATGSGLAISIHDEVMKKAEGRRAISETDLKRYAKHEGDFYMFRLKAKQTPEGNIKVSAKDLWVKDEDRGVIDKYNFVLEAREDTGWRIFAVFRPHEIASLKIK